MVTVEEVQKLYNQILIDNDTAKNKLSVLDNLEQDILHYIEYENYSAAQGSQLIKKLREERKERRNIKYRCQELQCLVDRLSRANLNDISLKSSNYLRPSLEDILNKNI